MLQPPEYFIPESLVPFLISLAFLIALKTARDLNISESALECYTNKSGT
jgi:hypothetical protein